MLATPPPIAVARDKKSAADSDDDAPASEDAASLYRDAPKFKTFRKHTRDLYQSIATNETLWPAKSVQFLPYYRELTPNCVEQTVLTGTCTVGQEQNYLKLLSLVQPANQAAVLAGETYDEELRELGACGMAPASCRFRVDLLIAHSGDVRKARCMPHNPNVFASSSSDEKVYIFDRSSILRTAPPNQPTRPLLPLLGPKPGHDAPSDRRKEYQNKKFKHDNTLDSQAQWDAKRHPAQHKLALDADITNAWALDWSPVTAGLLCAGGNEGVAVWALAEVRKNAAADVQPLVKMSSVDAANDAKWALDSDNQILVATGNGNGGSATIVDLRSAASSLTVATQAGLVNSVDWSPHRAGLMAVGAADGVVRTYDVRQPAVPLLQIQAHAPGSEVSVVWCPHDANLVATAGGDGNSAVMRIDPTGARVLFVHTGHQDPVTDVTWSPHDAFAGQLLSVDDNAICAWKPRNKFWR
jgi:WD40 repeat protein